MLGLASTVSSSSTPESKYSLDFDGTDDHVSLGASNSIMTTSQSEASLSVWIKATGAESNGRYIFQNQKGESSTNFGLRINNDTGLAEALMWNGSSHSNPSSTTDVTDGNWHHVVITGKASEQKIYVDGSVEDTHAAAFSMTPSADDCTIGSLNGDNAFFNGKIDNVALWSVVLDADAVTAIYNSGKPTNLTFDSGNYDNSSALVAYYRMGNGSFDDKANGVVHDQHASGFGANVVVNGTFNSNTSSWAQDSGADLTWQSDGTLLVETTADATFAVKQTSILTSGKVYKVTFRIKPDASGTIRTRLGGSGASFSTTSFTAGQFNDIVVYGRAVGTFLEIGATSGIDNFYLDDVVALPLNGLPALTSDADESGFPFSSDTP